jgi:SAM-dependent methyltransferase
VSLDFAAAFCVVNVRLTELTGLKDRIEVVHGDGATLPLKDVSFDLVWMQQAAMNIEDKEALASEIRRVLRPGGVYAFQEIVAGEDPGPLVLPVAWAARQEDSHLEPPSSMRERLMRLGLDEMSFDDITSSLLPGLRARLENVEMNGPPTLGVHLLSTSPLEAILRGMLSSAESRRIGFVRGLFRVRD